jgi:hypothetical protein
MFDPIGMIFVVIGQLLGRAFPKQRSLGHGQLR